MAVDNLIMPETVSVGFKGGPTFSTGKVSSVSQQTRRFPNQEVAVHKYSWNLQNADNEPTVALIDWLRGLFFDRRGDLKTFLMKDWADYKLVAEQFFVGDGVTTTAQVTKTYTAGFNPYVRIIRHLKAGTAVFKLDGVPLVLGVDYTINSTARVTYATPPADGAAGTIDGQFYVPVNLEGDAFNATLPEQNEYIVNVDLQAIEDIP